MSQNQPDDNLYLLWGNPSAKQTYQEFVEEGIEHFKKKFGYAPNLIEYCSEDDKLNIEGIECVTVGGVLKYTIRLYPGMDIRN
jgi:hypothetical protein